MVLCQTIRIEEFTLSFVKIDRIQNQKSVLCQTMRIEELTLSSVKIDLNKNAGSLPNDGDRRVYSLLC